MGRPGANHWEHAAIGDAFNVASQVEAAINEMGVPALVSEATTRRLDDRSQLKPLGEIAVEGRAEPIGVFTLATSLDAAR